MESLRQIIGGISAASTVKLASSVDDVIWLAAFLTPNLTKGQRTIHAFIYLFICLLQTLLAFIISTSGEVALEKLITNNKQGKINMSTDRILTLVAGCALGLYAIKLGIEWYRGDDDDDDDDDYNEEEDCTNHCGSREMVARNHDVDEEKVGEEEETGYVTEVDGEEEEGNVYDRSRHHNNDGGRRCIDDEVRKNSVGEIDNSSLLKDLEDDVVITIELREEFKSSHKGGQRGDGSRYIAVKNPVEQDDHDDDITVRASASSSLSSKRVAPLEMESSYTNDNNQQERHKPHHHHHHHRHQWTRAKALAIVAFLGSLDDSTLFVPMLVGRTFGIFELVVGATLSALLIILLCLFITRCAMVSNFLQRIPLVVIVALFATMLLVKGMIMD